MTVQELIAELEGCQPDAQVRIAHQPNWPFEYSIGEVADMGDHDPREDYEILRDDDGWYIESDGAQEDGPFETDADAERALDEKLARENDPDAEGVVYIGEGHQIGYLPGNASRALGWR